jgi:hypothetical protein
MAITKATASSIAPAAKGDLVVGSATNDAGVLAVGTDTHILVADSAESLGMKWAAPAGSVGFTSTAIYNYVGSCSTAYLDSPNTTSATTYKTQFKNDVAAAAVGVQTGSATSTITLMEIGA